MSSNINVTYQDIYQLLTFYADSLWNYLGSNHTTVITLISIAIASILIMGAAILIRQQKIMKMLRDLTPPKAESPREEDTAAKETE